MNAQESRGVQYQVVVNMEEQYSIWPLGRALPLGWQAAPKNGSKEECLRYIDEVWVDMRPASLRRELAPDR
jgi:MbtH protein